MKNKLFIYYSIAFFVVVLGLAGCSPIGILKPDQPKVDQVSNDTNEISETELPNVDGLTFVSYTNRSVGYTVDRPNRWYWRHYIKSQIGTSHPKVDDYFMTSAKPLPGLEAEVLGQIVIEVRGEEVNEVTTGLDKFSKVQSQIGGLEGVRYEGTRKNAAGGEIKVIEYQMRRDDQSFRFIYTQSPGETDNSQVFERVVKSFVFGV